MIGLKNNYADETTGVHGFPFGTEVKTKHGWKKVEDGDEKKDLLLLASRETLEIHYGAPERKVLERYVGLMSKFETDQIDLFVPAASDLSVHVRTRTNNEEGYKPMLQIAMDARTRYDLLPVSGFQYSGGNTLKFVLPEVTFTQKGKAKTLPEKEIDLAAWLEFFGFWLADGCCRGLQRDGKVHSFDVYIKQKAGNDDYILSLMRNIGFEPTVEYYQSGNYSNYCIRSRQLWEYLRQFGKSSDNYVPEEFLSLAPEDLEALFKGYTNGDSSKNGDCIVLSSKSKRLMDNMQELVLKLDGSVAQVRKVTRKKSNGSCSVLWRLLYVPQEKRRRKHYVQYGEPQTAHYEGDLCSLCAGEDELVLLRRGGKVMWATC